MSELNKKTTGKQWSLQDQKLYVGYKNRIDAGEKLPETECREFKELVWRFLDHRLNTDSEFKSAYEILAKGFMSVSDLKAQGVKLTSEEVSEIQCSFIKLAVKRGAFNLGNICENVKFS